jgi:hypothetical protein
MAAERPIPSPLHYRVLQQSGGRGGCVTTRRLIAVPVATGMALLVGWATASPALATVPDDGDEPGAGLSALQTILIYVVVPAGLLLLIALLVMAPSIAHGPRYRPGLGWFAAPVWFGGPSNPDSALARARSTAAPAERGGASARW